MIYGKSFVGFIYNNPKQTLTAIKSGVVNAAKAFAQADSFEKGRVVGRIVGEIGLAVVGTKGIDKLAKVARGSKVLGEVGNVAKVADKVDVFPDKPNNLLPEISRTTKVRSNGSVSQEINTSDNLRIRAETHPLKPGETYNPRHHGQHYHVERRIDPTKS